MSDGAKSKTPIPTTASGSKGPAQARPSSKGVRQAGHILEFHRQVGNQALAGLFQPQSPIPEAVPLEASVRESMESRFEADFSQVRVHAGERAAALARSHHARAFTQGQSIVFGAGQFSPNDHEGRRLLSHELAHVVQQSRAGGASPGSSHEREAESAAALGDGPGTVPITLASAFGAIQCAPDPDVNERKEESPKNPEPKKPAPPPTTTPPVTSQKASGPKQVFQAKKIKTDDKVDASTDSLIQAALETSAVLNPYIKGKLSGASKVQIPGSKFVRHQTEDDFDKAAKAGGIIEKDLAPFGSQAEKDHKAKLHEVGGFYDRPTDTIHLPPWADVGNALHESIHKFGSGAVKTLLGDSFDEGVTQYFTNLVLTEQTLLPGKTTYNKDQLPLAEKLVRTFGRDTVATAYFEGNTAPLVKKIAEFLGIDVSKTDLSKWKPPAELLRTKLH